MRLRALVLSVGFIIIPLGVLQNLGVHSWLNSSVEWQLAQFLNSSTPDTPTWLPSAAIIAAYAAYGMDGDFPVDAPPSPPANSGSIHLDAGRVHVQVDRLCTLEFIQHWLGFVLTTHTTF